MENEKKEDHIDDKDDVRDNWQDEEEEHSQNFLIGNHDTSRNTEAMDGKLEQSQSILGAQSEGDKPTAIMKKTTTYDAISERKTCRKYKQSCL